MAIFRLRLGYPFTIHILFTGISKRLISLQVNYPKMSNSIFAGNTDKLVKLNKRTSMATLWVWACAVIQSMSLWNGVPYGSHLSWWSGTFLGFGVGIKNMCWESNRRMSLILTVHTSFWKYLRCVWNKRTEFKPHFVSVFLHFPWNIYPILS